MHILSLPRWSPLGAAVGVALLLQTASAAPAGAVPPAGEVAWQHYLVRSAATGKIERFWVGKPAGLKPDAKYPALYLLDGLLGNEHEWKDAVGPYLAKYEMIAVCPSVGGGTWFLNSPREPWMKWGDFLTDELRAFVEDRYPVSPEKGQRGLIGISAGGNAALYYAIKRPDLYGAVSVLSGAVELRGYVGQAGLDYWIGPRTPEAASLCAERSAVALLGKMTEPLASDLFLDVGDKDGTLAQMTVLRQPLDARKVPYKWNVGQGAHNWTYWKSRTPDHLAWFAEAFAAAKREGRFREKPAAADIAKLEVLKALPEASLSAAARERLTAPWTGSPGRPIIVTGIPKDGAPLSAKDPKYAEAKLSAPLGVRGHEKGLWLLRLTLTVASPLPRAGEVTLGIRVTNGRNTTIVALPAIALAVPAGEGGRRVEVHVRLAVELAEPDPIRGGILAAAQVFGPDDKPLGAPVIGQAQPGSAALELWPVAPEGRAEFTLTLKGEKALPMAAVNDARLVAE